MNFQRTFWRFLALSAFFFVIIQISRSVETRLGVAAGRQHSQDFSGVIQHVETTTQDSQQRDPARFREAGRAIRLVRYQVQGVTAAFMAVFVIWFTHKKYA